MRKINIFRFAIGLLLFSLGVATGLVAQTNSNSPQRIEKNRINLTGAPGMEVIVSTADYKPGESMEAPHIHHGIEVAYVIQGGMVQVPGKEDPVMFPTGASGTNLRDVKHGGLKVVGDTTLRFFTVHIVDKEKPLFDYSR